MAQPRYRQTPKSGQNGRRKAVPPTFPACDYADGAGLREGPELTAEGDLARKGRLPNSPPPKATKHLRSKLFYAMITMMTKLNDVAVAFAAGVPAATLAAWLRRGHLRRPAAGWRAEDATLLRCVWLLSASGMEPAVALRLCDAHRAAIWRGAGWLVAIRRHSCDLFSGATVSAEALALDRREDVVRVLERAASGGADMTEMVLLNLAEARQKCELGLAHFLSTRRPRGRPRKREKEDA